MVIWDVTLCSLVNTSVLEEPGASVVRTEDLLGDSWFLQDAGIHLQNHMAPLSESA
jgi:hypothetical protein